MRRFLSTQRLGRVASRLTVVMGLVGFIVANTGLPVVRPVVPRSKDKSKAFLCQDRPCGCMSADECLRGCCCFTASQRLAWAKENNIEAPPELLAEAARDLAKNVAHDCDHDHAGDCCSESAPSEAQAASCASCDHDHPAAGHEHAEREHGSHRDHDDAPGEHGWRVTMIIGPLASHCRGLGPLSVLTFSALPPTASVSYQYDWCPSGWLESASPRALSVDVPPPTRPPCA